jgi:hypothetical protein
VHNVALIRDIDRRVIEDLCLAMEELVAVGRGRLRSVRL